MQVANYINRLFIEFWLDCNIAKIKELQEGIGGLTDEHVLSILHGEQHFVDTDGGMDLEDFHTEEDWSNEAVECLFKSKYEDLYTRTISYSLNLARAFEENDKEEVLHLWKLMNNYHTKLNELRNNYTLFLALTNTKSSFLEGDFMSKVYDSLKLDDLESEIGDLKTTCTKSYEDLVKGYLHKLSLDHLHIRNLLMLNGQYTSMEMMELTGTNGVEFLTEYKNAQLALENVRGNNIVPEDILKCFWNSGWLAPNGDFYGCADLSHTQFTNDLIGCLDYKVDGNSDRFLEVNGWIKFSSGRWLYYKEDFKPTKEQLEIIKIWADKRANTHRVYLGESFIGLDVLESLIKTS